MQISKKKNKKPYIITVLIIVAIAVGAFFLYQYRSSLESNTHTSSNDPSKPISTESDKNQAKELQEDSDNKNSSPNTDKQAQPAKDTSSGKNTVQMIASADISDRKLYIRGGVNSVVPEDGICYALLKGPSDQVIRKNTSILQNPASTDCKTISVSTVELTPGEWKFTLHYSSKNYEGASSEAAFSI